MPPWGAPAAGRSRQVKSPGSPYSHDPLVIFLNQRCTKDHKQLLLSEERIFTFQRNTDLAVNTGVYLWRDVWERNLRIKEKWFLGFCFYHQVCRILSEKDNKRSKQFTIETVSPHFPILLLYMLSPFLFPTAHAGPFLVQETGGRRNSSKVKFLDESNKDSSRHRENPGE